MTDIEKVRLALQLPKELSPQLEIWINMAESYIKHAGVKEDEIGTDKTYSAVCKGVFDIWTSNSFSPMFHEIVSQLALSYPSHSSSEEEDVDYDIATEEEIDDLFD